MINSITYDQTIVPLVPTDVVGAPIFCADFVIQAIELVASGTANLNVQVLISYKEEAPDWSSETAGNVQVKDKADDTPYDATEGITFIADATRLIEINADGARWVGLIVPKGASNAGSLAATYHLKNNQ